MNERGNVNNILEGCCCMLLHAVANCYSLCALTHLYHLYVHFHVSAVAHTPKFNTGSSLGTSIFSLLLGCSTSLKCTSGSRGTLMMVCLIDVAEHL